MKAWECTAENGGEYIDGSGVKRIAQYGEIVYDIDPKSIMVVKNGKTTNSLMWGWRETTYIRPATAMDIAKKQEEAIEKLKKDNKKFLAKNKDLEAELEKLRKG